MLASRVLEDPKKQNFTPFPGLAKMTPSTLVHKLYNELGWRERERERGGKKTDWRKTNTSVSHCLTFNYPETCY
jgi:hypothetical protein